jgi:hypothetical protein
MTAKTTDKPPSETVCTRCGESKAAECFPRDKRNTARGVSSHCKSCHIAASTRWQADNRDKVNETRRARYARNREQIVVKRREAYDSEAARWRNIKRLYSMSREEYEARLEAQGGGCAICATVPASRALAVDHDHKCCANTPTCGKCTRGLLCGTCNTSLHAIENKPDWLANATTYLGAAQ